MLLLMDPFSSENDAKTRRLIQETFRQAISKEKLSTLSCSESHP